ncbi:hypothetical protein JET14_17115 [Martelella lutilitoris]|uniref:Uncharacterized protein n=1 Tax=Martelella lutilitoris TaxID=2583532 RepID=A0A7T7KLK4_9HYPH|nr:hypothetical protein [Martelella lutilitoris]QQM29989.1 hypothetical protein JET14_17115 [Martelella lutilitoris]
MSPAEFSETLVSQSFGRNGHSRLRRTARNHNSVGDALVAPLRGYIAILGVDANAGRLSAGRLTKVHLPMPMHAPEMIAPSEVDGCRAQKSNEKEGNRGVPDHLNGQVLSTFPHF